MAIEDGYIRQAAALAMRNGRICLVTSRSNSKRWVIPKGLIEPGQTAGETALQEAWEEAGLTGTLVPEPVGSYLYEKYGGVCHVTVFLMHVAKMAQAWPERDERERCWLSAPRALARIDDPGLADVVRTACGDVLAHASGK
jgi:8-oxo-dGTP pyrophosphatase MutT (NUDIX family)